MTRLYERAEVYEIGFSYRDVRAECQFILQACGRVATNVDRLLEVACGPGFHALEMARRGIDVVAIDKDDNMLERLRQQAMDRCFDIQTVNGDIRSFAVYEKVDLAICMLGVGCPSAYQ